MLHECMILIVDHIRVPVGKTLGIPLTATVFTNPGSQVPAERAGFIVDSVVTFEELDKIHGFKFPGNTVESQKLMSMRLI